MPGYARDARAGTRARNGLRGPHRAANATTAVHNGCMRKGMAADTGYARSAALRTPPHPAGEWRVPATLADLVAELDLCGVPLNADPSRACLLLELSGTWASHRRVVAALRRRAARANA